MNMTNRPQAVKHPGELKDLLGDEVDSEITKYPDFEHLEAAGRGKE